MSRRCAVLSGAGNGDLTLVRPAGASPVPLPKVSSRLP
jgi:hypothetical protein